MVHSNEIKNKIDELKDSGKTFAEFLSEIFKDKFIEIYLGDSYEEVSTEQVSTAYPAVFCGKVIGAYRECLIISAAYNDRGKSLKMGNVLFLSERAIRAVTEIDGNGILEDSFMRSRESLEVNSNFGNE